MRHWYYPKLSRIISVILQFAWYYLVLGLADVHKPVIVTCNETCQLIIPHSAVAPSLVTGTLSPSVSTKRLHTRISRVAHKEINSKGKIF